MSSPIEGYRAQYGIDVRRAPIILLPQHKAEEHLSQPVSWSDRGVVRLREFVAVNLTANAHHLDVIPQVSTEIFPQPSQLTGEQARNAILQSIDEGRHSGEYTHLKGSPQANKWKEEIIQGTLRGQEEMGLILDSWQLIVNLVAAGKFRLRGK